VKVETESDLQQVWAQQKQAEKAAIPSQAPPGLLAGVPTVLPALMQAEAYQRKAAKVGFDWPTIEPVIAKIVEEIEEIKQASDSPHQQAEIGDLLFAAVNWARWLEVDPEIALREASGRFRRRFEYIEAHSSTALDQMSLEQMDALWDEAKQQGL
jgi:MazG family protein